MPRRCPRRAEIFRGLDAYCEALRLEESLPLHFPRSPSSLPAEASREEEESNSPPLIEYFKQCYRKYYKALTGMEPNAINSPFSAENFESPPPENRQLTVSNEDEEQRDGNKHSSEDAYQTILDGEEDEQGSNHFFVVPSKRQRNKSLSPTAYAVQCAICEKWRLIQTKQKYDELRAQIEALPFTCEMAREWKPHVACNDPSDVSQDDKWLWGMDKHDIPQAPLGFERLIAIRVEPSTRFADVYYVTPSRRRLRSSIETQKYLNENPEYAAQGVNISQFSFKIPAPSRQVNLRKRAKLNGNNDLCNESSGEANRPVLIALRRCLPSKYTVQPRAWPSPPLRIGNQGTTMNQLVPYSGNLPELQRPEPPVMKLGNSTQPAAI